MLRADSRLAQACLAAMLLAGCGDSRADSRRGTTTEDYIASASCPLKSLQEWQDFLVDAAQESAWLTTCSDLDNCSDAVGNFSVKVRAMVETLDLCAADREAMPALDRCSERLRKFAPVWLRQHSTDSYGFDQANAEYFAGQVAADQPLHMMEPPVELLAAFPKRADIEAAARSRGFPYLTHDSGLGGTRMFVFVPDAADRFEQWLVFGLDAAAEQTGSSEIVSFFAIQKADASGKELVQPRIHFRDYVVRADNDWRAELPETGSGKCAACHVGGPRELIPQAGQFTSAAPVAGEAEFGGLVDETVFGAARLASFNQRIAGYGVLDFAGALEPTNEGPALGSALGCTSCHDDTTRGALRVLTSEGTLWQKTVQQLSMQHFDATHAVPDQRAMALLAAARDGDLPDAAAAELVAARATHGTDFQTLMTSRSPELAAWLLATVCQ